MTPQEIEQRIQSGEDSRTEFKSTVGAFDGHSAAKEMCAFANSGGGDVFYGVEDDGTITGVGSRQQSDELQTRIAQAAADLILPPLRVRLLSVVVRSAIVVVARVPAFLPGRPFATRSKYMIRDGPSSREARPDELKVIVSSGLDRHLDETAMEDAALDDLDPDALRAFMTATRHGGSSGTDLRYLASLGAVDASGVPSVAGILMFGRTPQSFLVDAYVSALRVDGTKRTGPIADMRDIGGTLPRQLDEAVAFIERHTEHPSKVEGLHRVELGVPAEVWREAVTNAIAHRDYNVASQTTLRVFDDRVEIANPGELLNKLTVDKISVGGISQRRNPLISALLHRLRLADNVGFGIPEIMQRVTAIGLPPPVIDVKDGYFRLTIFTRAPS